jgi:hypothetical protein
LSFEAVAILPRTGIGALRFGQNRSAVRELLGDPTGVDARTSGRETWEYDFLDLGVSFDDDADWRLVSLCIQNARFTLRGISLVGLPYEAIVRLAPRLKIGCYERSDDSPFGPTLEFPDHEIAISFYDGAADFVTWCVPIDDRDEYIWPDLRVVA